MPSKTKHNGRALVIVESPSKARTINRYLGDDFDVQASMGHVRDLPESDIGIDFTNRFEPVYEVLPDKRRVISKLKKSAKGARDIYLATDLDREGEAIAWHLAHALGLDPETTKRVVFNEITKSAIHDAFAKPHGIDMDKVNAQQARRLLDRIVGYQLSPLLQQKIGKRLSAGRVQSVAVRIIVEREREIRDFVPEESWRVFACFATDPAQADALESKWREFMSPDKKDGSGPTVKQRNQWLSKNACVYAELIKVAGQDPKLNNLDAARPIIEALGIVVDDAREEDWKEYARLNLKTVTISGHLDRSAAPAFSVKEIQTRKTQSKPSAPFTTAALQQAASTMLGFSPSRTMRVAQSLYEGVDLGGSDGATGLITYMRTDSTNLSNDSVQKARELIGQEFGDKYLPGKPNRYGSAKRAQEAHEAIRPTDVQRTPDGVKGKLSAEQHRLYDLIWRRFVACQMTPAQWESTTLLIGADTTVGEAIFKATGRRLLFDGFQRVMGTSTGDDVVLPKIDEGAPVGPVDLMPRQEYTSPPARYTEASLIKKLEAEGIGRPSTYAAIIETVQKRGYVEQKDRKLFATDMGEIVTDKLVAHFPGVMDMKFTSYMEDELDKIEEAHLDWVHVLTEFYEPFRKALEAANVEMDKVRAEPSPYTCEECSAKMVYRWGKNGRFLACSAYPECKNSKEIDSEGKPIELPHVELECEVCSKPMQVKRSRQGLFLGCSGYPECTNIQPCDEKGQPLTKVKPEEIKESCPDCGTTMEVKWARGRAFLGCTRYPKCKGTKNMPEGVYVEKPKPKQAGARCDKCGRAIVIRKGRRGEFLSCSGFPKCRNAMPLEKLDELKAKEAAGEIPDEPTEPVGGGRKVAAKRNGKVDVSKLGPPPEGFAWTRTGRPVVETWPEDGLKCPECGGEVVVKTGRFGPFWACAKPRCKFTANMRGEAKKRGEKEFPTPAKPAPKPTDVPCPDCGSKMLIRTGRTGPFLGCSAYPKCKATQPIPDGETVESLVAPMAE